MKEQLVISIEPEAAEKILSGEKLYEIRARKPSRDVDSVLIHICGESSDKIEMAALNPVWGIGRMPTGFVLEKLRQDPEYEKEVGMTEAELYNTFHAEDYVTQIKLYAPKRFTDPIPITEIGLKNVPRAGAFAKFAYAKNRIQI